MKEEREAAKEGCDIGQVTSGGNWSRLTGETLGGRKRKCFGDPDQRELEYFSTSLKDALPLTNSRTPPPSTPVARENIRQKVACSDRNGK